MAGQQGGGRIVAWHLRPSAYLETCGDSRPERPPEVTSIRASHTREAAAGALSLRVRAPFVTEDQFGSLRDGQRVSIQRGDNPLDTVEAVVFGGVARAVIAEVKEEDADESSREERNRGSVDASGEAEWIPPIEDIPEQPNEPSQFDHWNYEWVPEPVHEPEVYHESSPPQQTWHAAPQEPAPVAYNPPADPPSEPVQEEQRELTWYEIRDLEEVSGYAGDGGGGILG